MILCQFQRVAFQPSQGDGDIRGIAIVPGAIDHLEGDGLADGVLGGVGIGVSRCRCDCGFSAGNNIPCASLIGIGGLGADSRDLILRQYQRVAFQPGQGNGNIGGIAIIPGAIDHLEGDRLADAILGGVGIGVGRCRCDRRFGAGNNIPCASLIGIGGLGADSGDLILRQLQRIALVPSQGHGLFASQGFIIPGAVHYLKGHCVRNKSPDRQFLIVGGKGRIRCFYAHIICTGNKSGNFAACSGRPFLSIRLLVLHLGRNAGELSIVVVCGRAVHCGGCCGRVRFRLCRGRGQRDGCISGGRAGNRDLRVAVAGHGDTVDSGNAVICWEIISVICGIDHVRHCTGQIAL